MAWDPRPVQWPVRAEVAPHRWRGHGIWRDVPGGQHCAKDRIGSNINVTGSIGGTGYGAYLQLHADAGGTGVGTVGLAAASINLLGMGSAVDIDYNPAALGSPTDFSPGVAAGTLTSYQLVDTVTQLQTVGGFLGQNFALGRDIDATQTQGWNGGAGFVPIRTAAAPFTGNFDGLGHVVTGLYINAPSSDGVGLFGAVEAVTPASGDRDLQCWSCRSGDCWCEWHWCAGRNDPRHRLRRDLRLSVGARIRLRRELLPRSRAVGRLAGWSAKSPKPAVCDWSRIMQT